MTGPVGTTGDRGISAYERGLTGVPSVEGRDVDEPDTLEYAIAGDPILTRTYEQLVKSGWRISRLALTERYRLDTARKTITFDARLDISRIPGAVAAAVRQVYRSDPRQRRVNIKNRVEELLKERRSGATLTDLEIMAQAYAWATWFFTDLASTYSVYGFKEVMADLLRVLSGQRSRGRWQDMGTPGFVDDGSYYVGHRSFESTGFKREYRDTSNQVRHATASLTLFVVFGSGWLVLSRAQSRENPNVDFADIRLNEKLADISMDIAGSARDGPDSVAALIRRELGDPAAVAPWPKALEHGVPNTGD
jgi:hypothetical protein